MKNILAQEEYPEIEQQCRQIKRCNQRGGRMLSVVDMVEAGTVSVELAAFLLHAISRGGSFMVGANPGGAGKTTVMGALLNFVPVGTEFIPTESPFYPDRIETHPPCWYICHEISPGSYYAYLWEENLQRLFSAVDSGHMLATNLHADTFNQARHQICIQNRVPEENFNKINILIFLSVKRTFTGVARTVSTVWVGDGKGSHSQLDLKELTSGLSDRNRQMTSYSKQTEQVHRNFILELVKSGEREIRSVRKKVCEFLEEIFDGR